MVALAKVHPVFLAAILLATLLSGCADEDGLPPAPRVPAAGTGTAAPAPVAEVARSPPPAASAPAVRPGTVLLTLQRQVGSDSHFSLAAAFRDASGRAVEAPATLEWTATAVRRADHSGQPTQATPETVGRGGRLPAVFQVAWDLPGTYSIAASVRAPGFREGSQVLQVHRTSHGGSGSPAPPSMPPQEAPGSTSVTLSNGTLGQVPTRVFFTVAAAFLDAQGKPANATQVRWSVNVTRIADGSGAPVQDTVRQAAAGIALPATFGLNWTAAGTYVVVARVQAEGFKAGAAQLQLTATASPPPSPPPPPPPPTVLFEEAAEAGAGNWTFSGATVMIGGLNVPYPAPLIGFTPLAWTTTTAMARSGTYSWTAPYYNGYQADMVSPPIAIPADTKPHQMTFWLTGGVENNPFVGLDGLHVFVQAVNGPPTKLRYVTDDHPTWTKFSVPLDAYKGKTIQVTFSFQADFGCSAGDTQAGRDVVFGNVGPILFGTPCEPSSYAGYFIDDILVT